MITDMKLASEKRSNDLLDSEIDRRLDLLLANYQGVTSNPRSMGYLRFLLRHYAKSPTPWRQCFASDTLIDCERDYNKYPDGIPISELKSGQEVWSYNLEKNKYELKPIIDVWLTKKNADVIEITLDNNRSFKVTKDHKLLSSSGVWDKAASFKVGDKLFSSLVGHSLSITRFAIPIAFLRTSSYISSFFRPKMTTKTIRRSLFSVDNSLFSIMFRKRIIDIFLSPYTHMRQQNFHYRGGSMAVYSPLPSISCEVKNTNFEDTHQFLKRFFFFLSSRNNQSRGTHSSSSSFSSVVPKTSLSLQKTSGPSKFGVCEITGISHVEAPVDVWDMAVCDTHNFAVLGIIAHNCYKDNLRRFGPERTKGLCGVLKDVIRQNVYWRKGAHGHSKLPDVGAPGVAIAYADKSAANPPWHGNTKLSEIDMGVMSVPDEVCLILEDIDKQCDIFRVLIELDEPPQPSGELKDLL